MKNNTYTNLIMELIKDADDTTLEFICLLLLREAERRRVMSRQS